LKPIFSNIKEEVLCNDFSIISIHTWNQILQQSLQFFNTWNCQKIRSRCNGFFQDQVTGHKEKWQKNKKMSLQSVIVIKLYTNCDKLQYELKKCFRFDGSKNITEFKSKKAELEKRIQQFYHWQGKLLIVLKKFGVFLKEKVLYHGINNQMIINSSSVSFSGPLSASTDYHVARTFATSKGMVLKICSMFPRLNYCYAMDVSMISDYPEEQEWIIGSIYMRILRVITVNKITTSYAQTQLFVIHLFKVDIFTMSPMLESILLSFFNCINAKNNRNKIDPKLLKQFHEIRMTKQCAKFDIISDKLKTFLKSFTNITRIYPNLKKIIFLNQYKLDDIMLANFIKHIKQNKKLLLHKVIFLYYNDNNIFQNPDNLNQILISDLKQLSWTVKHCKQYKTGYKIKIINNNINKCFC
jgi:hypothetical protein